MDATAGTWLCGSNRMKVAPAAREDGSSDLWFAYGVRSGKQQGLTRGGYGCWRQLGKATTEVAAVDAIVGDGRR
ncbi:hypothetical protein B296_00057635 [Ensete ventricosum]|uniref:Uncharacterized protein n=1 Tax=Ensete ventricosum TaxID=4639 RepID=A0A426XQG6_ENSVE|nr:hypothetical protein B296_00057635 [Ensete ventricosum]